MKHLLLIIFLFAAHILYAQEDTSKYLKYPNAYGVKYPGIWASKTLRTPYGDTVAINPQPGAIQSGLDGNPYWWNGIKWSKISNTPELDAYVKYSDSIGKYVTPTQLNAYTWERSLDAMNGNILTHDIYINNRLHDYVYDSIGNLVFSLYKDSSLSAIIGSGQGIGLYSAQTYPHSPIGLIVNRASGPAEIYTLLSEGATQKKTFFIGTDTSQITLFATDRQNRSSNIDLFGGDSIAINSDGAVNIGLSNKSVQIGTDSVTSTNQNYLWQDNNLTVHRAAVNKISSGNSDSLGHQPVNYYLPSSTAASTYLPLAGGSMTGKLNVFGNDIAHYISSDTINYKAMAMGWVNSSLYSIGTVFGGTGSKTSIILGASTTPWFNSSGRLLTINPDTTNGYGIFDFNPGATREGIITSYSGYLSAISSFQSFVSIQPTINQSGAAGYVLLDIKGYDSTNGSATSYLIRASTSNASKGLGTLTPQFVVTNTGLTGIGTATPTHSLTFASGSTGFSIYNPSQPDYTNYERLVGQWQSNVFTLGTYSNSSGVIRSLQFGVQSTLGATTLTSARTFTIAPSVTSSAGVFDFTPSTTSLTPNIMTIQGTGTASSGSQNWVSIQPTISQSGTANSTALMVQPFYNTTGSGLSYLINAGTNSAGSGAGTYTPLFQVDRFGRAGIKTTAANTVLSIGGGAGSINAWGTSGAVVSVLAGTTADNSTAANATVGTVTAANSFGVPSFAASNANVTYTTAANVYIAGPPGNGSNVNITTSNALYVASGNSAFLGGISTRGDNNPGASNFFTPGSTSAALFSGYSGLTFGGTSSVYSRAGFNGNSNSTLSTAGSNYTNIIAGSSPLTTAASGTHALLANAVINPLGAVTSGGAAVTNTASLYVNGNASATVSGQNYALWVDAGTNTASSGTQTFAAITPTIAQSSTAGYSALQIAPFESSVGSGGRYLINAGTNSAASGGGLFTQRFSVASNGRMALGTNNLNAIFNINTSATNNAWGTTGQLFNVSASTLTDNSTAAGATVATTTVANSIGTPTITASNATSGSPVTYTNAANLYIQGAPGAGANTTITNPWALYVQGGNNFMGPGTTLIGNGSLIANSNPKLLINSGATGPNTTTYGVQFHSNNNSYTDNSTAASGTAAFVTGNSFYAPTFAASNTGVTYTTGATVYIQGAPAAGTNATISNNYALYVAGGNSNFNGLSLFAGGLRTSGSSQVGNLDASSAAGVTTTGAANYLFASASNVGFRTGIGGTTSSTLGANTSYSNLLVSSAPVTTSTGTHAVIANAMINPIGTVTAGSASVTETSSLYVNGASSAGTNNYALHVAGSSANSKIDGLLNVSTSVTTPAVLNIAAQSTVSGSTSGSAVFSEPEQGGQLQKGYYLLQCT